MKIKPNNNFLKYKIAHRGLHSEKISENSLEAFRLAIENNYAFEIDIHLMRDGKIAVIHDEYLNRVCGKEAVIERLTEKELVNYPLSIDGQIIPTLDQVFELTKGKVPILIELKFSLSGFDHNQVDVLLELLKLYPYDDMIALQSFNYDAVEYLKEHTNKYSVGLLASVDKNEKDFLKIYDDIGADFMSLDINHLPNKLILEKQKSGEILFVWTINTEEKAKIAQKFADNLIFEKIKV